MSGDRYPKVDGYCPMGCGPTLFLGEGGYVTCSWHACPNPSAVADLLEDRQLIVAVETFRAAATGATPYRTEDA